MAIVDKLNVFHCAEFCSAPFDAIENLLRDLVDVERLIPDERDVQAAPQCHLPQFLGVLVGAQAAVTEQESH